MTTAGTATASATPAEGRVDRRAVVGIVGASLAVSVVVVNNSSMNMALPEMTVDLGLDALAMRSVVVAYSLVFAALLLPAGRLCGRWGARRTLLVGLGVSVLGAALAFAFPVVWGVIAGRIVLGIGAALVMPASLAAAVAVAPDGRRSAAISVWVGVSVAGTASGPVLGGMLVSAWGWPAVFTFTIIASAGLAVLVLATLPALDPTHDDPLDPVITVLQIIGVAPVLVALAVVVDAPLIAALCAAASAAAWVVLSRRSVALGRGWDRVGLLGAALANMLMFFAVAGALFVLTQLLQFGFGFSPLRAGLAVLPVSAGMVLGTAASGRLAGLVGLRAAAAAGMGVLAAACAVVAVGAGEGPVVVLFAIAVAGLGVGLALPLVTEAVVAAAPPGRVGDAAAVNDTMQEFGFSAGVAVVGGVLAVAHRRLAGAGTAPGLEVVRARAAGDAAVMQDALDTFFTSIQYAFGAAALVVVLGAAVAWFLLPTPRRSERTH